MYFFYTLVLKSDNANGVFAFKSTQLLSRVVLENVGNVSFDVLRTIAYRGKVIVNWVIFRENGSRASDDFISPSGSLIFDNGEREKVGSSLLIVLHSQIACNLG